MLRAALHLRRTRSNAIKVGALTIDLDTCTAIADGKTLNLAKREHETLCILAEQFGKTLTGDMINRHLYGDEADQHPLSNIDAYICLLRKKLTQLSTRKSWRVVTCVLTGCSFQRGHIRIPIENETNK
ncbi:winged helix-turn-helix domain-containing protein [Thioclava atlantica]|uniref:Cell cycle transcriptional regulator ctra n=1 Tax=Thioclava atlantica TaxID=1317124 RepID=A0A085TVD4_9RHOB|nr:winged helix-turn-helix domain-containing protein [Thioclava atlantica]KFE34681.1 cell cycle transcriptional regulator ctra [Thioclava atlantica]